MMKLKMMLFVGLIAVSVHTLSLEHYEATGESYPLVFAQLGDEDKSLKARLFKWINMSLDAVYGLGCKFTGCLEPEPMYLAKMWHLMKAHRKRTKITKIIPTWPSPQLAPPAPSPVVMPAPVTTSTLVGPGDDSLEENAAILGGIVDGNVLPSDDIKHTEDQGDEVDFEV